MTNETLTLGKGAAKAAPKAAKQRISTFDAARVASVDINAKDEISVKPTWRKHSGRDYSNQAMIDIFESGSIINGDFTDAKLDGADFTFYQIGEVKYSAENYENLSPSEQDAAQRKGFVLQGCKFDRASVTDTNFAGCDLRWSSFKETDAATAAIFADIDEKGNVINESIANVFEVCGLTR